MWGTKKLLAREMKQNKNAFEKELAKQEMEQIKNLTSIHHSLSLIEKRLTAMEQADSEFHQKYTEDYMALLNRIDQLQERLTATADSLSGETKALVEKAGRKNLEKFENMEKLISGAGSDLKAVMESEADAASKSLQSAKTDIRKVLKTLQECEDICAENHQKYAEDYIALLNQIDQLQERLTATADSLSGEIRTVVEKSGKKNLEKFENMEKLISGTESGLKAVMESEADTASKSLQTVKTDLLKALKTLQEREDICAENIGTMNYAMQEIIRNITSLDEGNRLIIAELLLKDMVV